MADLMSSLRFAASGMETQARRLQHVSENIANADTPGYRRKLVNFQQTVDGVTAGDVSLDQGALAEIFDPGNPLADEAGYYSGSNVDLVIEVADAREAQRSYEANLKIFDQARQMTQGLFELLRR